MNSTRPLGGHLRGGKTAPAPRCSATCRCRARYSRLEVEGAPMPVQPRCDVIGVADLQSHFDAERPAVTEIAGGR